MNGVNKPGVKITGVNIPGVKNAGVNKKRGERS